jgi:hypothetical protein
MVQADRGGLLKQPSAQPIAIAILQDGHISTTASNAWIHTDTPTLATKSILQALGVPDLHVGRNDRI